MAQHRWNNILTVTESNRKEELEQLVDSGILTCVSMGEALLELRENKLYRTEAKTWEEYVQNRWQRTGSWSYQIMNAVKALKGLPAKTKPLVEKMSTRAARALASVPEAERQLVLEKAGKNGEVTAAGIETAAKPDFELDRVGRVIPKDVLEDWNRAKEVSRMFTNQVSRIKCAVEEGLEKDTRDVIYGEVGNSLIADLKNAYVSLGLIEPFAVCVTCQGKSRSKCTTCKGRGFISEFYWKHKIDNKTKALIEKATKK